MIAKQGGIITETQGLDFYSDLMFLISKVISGDIDGFVLDKLVQRFFYLVPRLNRRCLGIPIFPSFFYRLMIVFYVEDNKDGRRRASAFAFKEKYMNLTLKTI